MGPVRVMNLQLFSQISVDERILRYHGLAWTDRSGSRTRGASGWGFLRKLFPSQTFEPGRTPLRLT